MNSSKFFDLILAAFLALSVSSCSVIGGIFKTGLGVSIIIVVAVIVFVVMHTIRTGKGID